MSDPRICRRCGRADCDELEPGEVERLVAALALLPRDEEPDPNDIEPFV